MRDKEKTGSVVDVFHEHYKELFMLEAHAKVLLPACIPIGKYNSALQNMIKPGQT